MASLDPIPTGTHELLTVIFRALRASEGNAVTVRNMLGVLLKPPITEGDCRAVAYALAGACVVSNDPDDET